MLAALFFLSIGAVSVGILVKIGGSSDGPGALIFYIGAFFGFYLGLPLLKTALFDGSTDPEA